MIKLYLQMFAEGGEGGATASPAAPAGQPAQSPGDKQAAAALEKLRERLPKQQKRVEFELPTKQQPAQSAQTPPADKKPRFMELVKGEYKKESDEWVGGIVQERVKNIKQAEAERDALKVEREKLTPALELLAKKHNIPANDIDALVNKLTNDDSLYEDEALQKGIPVETLKEMKALEKQAAQLRQYQQQQAEEAAMQKHFLKITEQAQAVKQLYPSFDLQAEMNNPAFARLTHPSVGVDVKTAYEVIHHDQIQPAMAAAIAQKTSEKLANSMQAGVNRPSENGLNPSSNAVKLSEDAHTWSPEVLRQIAEDTKRGKPHRF